MDYSLIIKVANDCNMNCSYCYYKHNENKNTVKFMSYKTLECMIKKLLEHNDHHAEFIWHGGEPLLIGIETFKFIIEKQKIHNKKNLKIINSIQTNGTLLNEEYIDFFYKNNIHIGISIDGPFDIQTSQRGILISQYENILNSLKKLNEINGINYGVLCVVGKQHIKQSTRVFDFFNENKIRQIGFLPCLVQKDGVIDFSLTITPEEYGQFLVDFFEVWINSNVHGICVRNFDDCIRFFLNKNPKVCINTNSCDNYITVTSDGNLYLCDNFSLNEKYCIGNSSLGFDNIKKAEAMNWLEQSMAKMPTNCIKCKYYNGCHGGCKYQRWVHDNNMQKEHYYCKSTYKLYKHISQYFKKEN